MPFEPMPQSENWWDRTNNCPSQEHNPPTHMVITEPMVWVCPNCGKKVNVYPRSVTMST